MKSIRQCLLSVLAGTIGVTGAWGAAAIGCSSSGSSPPQEAGGPDGTTDATTGEDAQTDVLVMVDANMADASMADANRVDANVDTGAGPDADAAAPDGDAGLPDVRAFDGSAASFPGQTAASVCGFVAACCGTSADAATFNSALCSADLLAGGFQGSTTGANLFDGGNVAFNAVAAQACLDVLSQIDCSTNQAASPVVAQAYKDCFGVYSGLLAVGAPCKGTIECAPGGFCLPQDGGVGDAGAIGLCQALVADGGACGLPANASDPQSACSYRGSGNTGLFCQTFNPNDAGQPVGTAMTAWTCAPQEPIGTACLQNQDCISFGCHSHQCATTILGVGASTCTAFVVDAGTGD